MDKSLFMNQKRPSGLLHSLKFSANTIYMWLLIKSCVMMQYDFSSWTFKDIILRIPVYSFKAQSLSWCSPDQFVTSYLVFYVKNTWMSIIYECFSDFKKKFGFNVLAQMTHSLMSVKGTSRPILRSQFLLNSLACRCLKSLHTQQKVTGSPALAGRCGNPGDTVFLWRVGCCGDKRWGSESDDDVT